MPSPWGGAPVVRPSLTPRPAARRHVNTHADAMGRQDNAKTWTPAEIRLLLQLLTDPRMRDSWGRPSWKLIAKAMREAGYDRDYPSVRNHYARHLKGRARAAKGEAKKRCSVCGQIKAGHLCPGPPSVPVRPAHGAPTP